MRAMWAGFSLPFAIFATGCALLASGCSGSAETTGGSSGRTPSTKTHGTSSGDPADAPPDDEGTTTPDPSADSGTTPPGRDASDPDGGSTNPPPTNTDGPCDTSDACSPGYYCDATAKNCAAPPDPGNCPVNDYPADVHLQTYPNDAASQSYASISDTGNYPQPTCFLDLDHLYDPVHRVMQPQNVQLAAHFSLDELVGTELAYSHAALMNPKLVEKLEEFRVNYNQALPLSSGYRSPAHQRAVCQDMCGADSCGGLCAARSRHSWGDAADVALTPDATIAASACTASFNYVFREGNHLHVDLNPSHDPCTIDVE